MNFFQRNIEVKKVREMLSANQTPVDEDIFCSSLSNGRAKNFNKLNDEEFKGLKRLVEGFTHEELLEGIYSVAIDLKAMSSKEMSEPNDQQILKYLRDFELINSSNQFKLKSPKEDVVTLRTPFKRQSFFAATLISQLLSQVYLIRSSKMN